MNAALNDDADQSEIELHNFKTESRKRMDMQEERHNTEIGQLKNYMLGVMAMATAATATGALNLIFHRG